MRFFCNTHTHTHIFFQVLFCTYDNRFSSKFFVRVQYVQVCEVLYTHSQGLPTTCVTKETFFSHLLRIEHRRLKRRRSLSFIVEAMYNRISILYSSFMLFQMIIVWWVKRAMTQWVKKSFVWLGPGSFFVANRRTSSVVQMSPSKASIFSITLTLSVSFRNSQDFSKILSCVWYDNTLMILKHSAVSLGLSGSTALQGLGMTQQIRAHKHIINGANDFLSNSLIVSRL